MGGYRCMTFGCECDMVKLRKGDGAGIRFGVGVGVGVVVAINCGKVPRVLCGAWEAWFSGGG